MSRRAPRTLSIALEPALARLEPAGTLAAVQRRWDGVVGETVAAHARPVAEHGGVLEVACDEGVWAAELELLGPQLVAALNDALGAAELRSLRVRATAARHTVRPPKRR